MNCAVHWTAYVTAIVLPVIAVIGAWIAYRQSETARNKLKLDLFEKRMDVYQSVREMLAVVATHGEVNIEEQVKYLLGTRSAQWLFGPEVFTYLNETLWQKITDLGLHNSMSDGHSNDKERERHIRAKTDTIVWLMAQNKTFDNLCSDYLSLKH